MSINIGDKVQYSRKWLKSTGMITGPVPFAKGIVKEMVKFGGDRFLAVISWDTEGLPEKVLSSNLNVIGHGELE